MYFRVYLAALVSGLGSIYIGSTSSFSSAAMITLNVNTSRVYVPKGSEAESWMSSLPVLSAMPFALVVGIIMEKIGRKATIIALSIPATLGYVIIAVAQNIWMIYLGRILCGTFLGSYSTVYLVYIGEISPPEIRGKLTFFFTTLSHLNICVVNALALALEWYWIAAAMTIPPALMGIGVLFLPESPYWLCKRGRKEDAVQAITWFLGAGSSDDDDVRVILKQIEDNQLQMRTDRTAWQSLRHRSTIFPFVILIFCFIFHTWNGSNTINFFTSKFAPKSMEPALFSTIATFVNFVAIFPSYFMIDRMGRRFLLTISSAAMFVSTLALGIYYKLVETNPNIEDSISFMPLTFIALFYLSSSTGWAPIPFVLTGEYFPMETRGFASGMSTLACLAFLFSSTKSVNTIIHSVGNAGLFWIFSASALASFFFVIFFVPETKNKPLARITDYFESGRIMYWPRCGST